MVDALTPDGDEGRSKRRNAAGSGKHAKIRRCPNGGTRMSDHAYRKVGETQGTETSKYLQEKKENRFRK